MNRAGIGCVIRIGACAAVVWSGGAAAAAVLPLQRAGQQDAAPAPREAPPVGGSRTIRDGVYTVAQASRGEQRFTQACTACHTANEHTGRRFAGKWEGNTLGELFELVSNTMPEGEPGGLEPATYVDILAFFLRASGYPEGPEELPADPEALGTIQIVPLDR